MNLRAIEWVDSSADGQANEGADERSQGTSRLKLLDQRVLPEITRHLDLRDAAEVAAAIREMAVRGAPAIGVAAAFGMVLAAQRSTAGTLAELVSDLQAADSVLRASRPTAVNLFWALDRMKPLWTHASDVQRTRAALKAEALAIEQHDLAVNHAIARHALPLLPQGRVTFFHHCNTGALATVGHGTALGIIRTAHAAGREVMVYLDETRPRLQGAKLSSFELMAEGIAHAIVVDGASAHVMRTRRVDAVVVGCDRVAANGDVVNKIGTYNLALAARDNDVPFFVAAPSSTIDLATLHGDAVEIEEREASEITQINGVPIAPQGAPAFNPAFDVTPQRLVSAIITEHGVALPPFQQSLAALLNGKR